MDNKHLVNIAINHINEDNAHNIDGITKDIIERIDDEGKRLSTSIERSAEEIKLQASKINDITSNISDLSITSEEIIANVSSIKKTTAGLLDEQAQMSMKSDEISASVSRSNMDIDELSGRIQSAEFKITPEAIISTVTDSTTYTDDISGITTRLNEAEHKITPEAITSTVRDSVEYQGDFNSMNEDVVALNDSLVDLEGFVVTSEGKIIDLENHVGDLEGDYEDLQGRIVSAESSITQNATNISSKVSITDYDGNTIASKINQSATTISIDASRINLNGAVTFNSFDSSLQGTVNNKADSSDLGNLAYRDNIIKSNMSTALQNEINAKLNESTIIEGGYIKTSYIDVTDITRIGDDNNYLSLSNSGITSVTNGGYYYGENRNFTIKIFPDMTRYFDTMVFSAETTGSFYGYSFADGPILATGGIEVDGNAIIYGTLNLNSATITGLSGSDISSGTVPYARLPSDNLVHSSGSATRGKWIRFGSGIQMCWYNTILTYNSETTIDNSWTYPMPFIDPPAVSGNSTNNATVVHRALAIHFTSVTNSGCIALISRPTGSTDFTSSSTRSVSLMAIGMWK